MFLTLVAHQLLQRLGKQLRAVLSVPLRESHTRQERDAVPAWHRLQDRINLFVERHEPLGLSCSGARLTRQSLCDTKHALHSAKSSATPATGLTVTVCAGRPASSRSHASH